MAFSDEVRPRIPPVRFSDIGFIIIWLKADIGLPNPAALILASRLLLYPGMMMNTLITTTRRHAPLRNMPEAIGDEITSMKQLARWYTTDPHEAEDLVQDTMLLALRFQGSFQPGTNMRAWLARVMRNKHISNTRRKRLERRALELEGTACLLDWSVGEAGRKTTRFEGDVDQNDGLSDPVVAALSSLKPEFREVVVLCDLDGMSYADAATVVRCPVGTVMSRLHRGRRALRSRLGSRLGLVAA